MRRDLRLALDPAIFVKKVDWDYSASTIIRNARFVEKMRGNNGDLIRDAGCLRCMSDRIAESYTWQIV
jgi:hypothetical protein